MISVSVTKARDSLKDLIVRVCENQTDVHILRGADALALLTLERPKQRVPAMRLKLDDARKGWAKLLEVVAARGARFQFRLVDRPAVYLVRAPGYTNRFVDEWREHLDQHRPDSATTPNEVLSLLNEVRAQGAEQAERLERIEQLVSAHQDGKSRPAAPAMLEDSSPLLRYGDDLDRNEES